MSPTRPESATDQCRVESLESDRASTFLATPPWVSSVTTSWRTTSPSTFPRNIFRRSPALRWGEGEEGEVGEDGEEGEVREKVEVGEEREKVEEMDGGVDGARRVSGALTLIMPGPGLGKE